ncbi:hypothetical protein [Streptomyces youssoufiensis]
MSTTPADEPAPRTDLDDYRDHQAALADKAAQIRDDRAYAHAHGNEAAR